MIQITGYELPFFGEASLEIPYGARSLSIKMEHRKLVLFALVDSESTVETRRFRVYSTGEKVSRPDLDSLSFIGTVQDEHWSEAWHVFEYVSRR